MHLQWGETGTAVLRRRLEASTARIKHQHETLRRQQRQGQGVTRPLEAVPEMDRYMYDLQGVSAALAHAHIHLTHSTPNRRPC